jgi:hypothetical protein
MRSSASAQRTSAAARFGLLTGAVAYSWLAGGLRENTLPAAVAVVVPGIAAVVVARRGTAATAPSSQYQPAGAGAAGQAPPTVAERAREHTPDGVDTRGATVWGLWLLAFLLWEAGAFLFQESPTIPNHDHPTLSLLMDPLLQPQPVRALGYLAWLLGGWRLLRR